MTTDACTFADPPTARPGVGGRLLLLSTAMGMGGGAEEQVIRLACGFQDRGWTPRIVSLLPPTPMPPGFEARGIGVEHLGMRKAIPDPRGVLRLARVVRAFRPDVVHSHMVHANLLARAVRMVAPFPVLVCTHHNQTMAGVTRDWGRLFEVAHRLTDGAADFSTAISRSATDYYIRCRAVPASKMAFLPNGIEIGKYRPDPEARDRLRRELGVEDRFVWLAVGRLEAQKAYPTLLKAVAGLGDDPRGRVVLICGRGSLRDDLEALASGLGLGDRVRFLGLRSDIPAVMSAADAFALSSDLEGLPLVLLQASAAALPIVATDVGGNAEVVGDGETGFVVPPGDPAAFGAAMARMEALPDERRRALGRLGQARVNDLYDEGRVVDRWEELFARLLGRGASARRLAGGMPPELTRGWTCSSTN
ncbi:MAG: glycosyltransferase [Thermoleophilia bacterium]|nr:glycosyltransferase [Thermoleophilia bacterium]